MRRSNLIQLCSTVLVVYVTCSQAFAGPFTHTGDVSLSNWQHESGVTIPLMQVKYRFSVLVGEPLRAFAFKYDPPDDGTKISNIKLRARLLQHDRKIDAYVVMSPLVVKPGEMGWDVPGSPSWGPGDDTWRPTNNPLFMTDGGTAIPAEEAKDLFRSGFSLTDLEVISITIKDEKDSKSSNDSSKPPTWLRRVFKGRIGQIGDYDREIEDGKWSMKGEYGINGFGYGANFHTESNLPVDEFDVDDEHWMDAEEHFEYHKIGFAYQGPILKADKTHTVDVQYVWETKYPNLPKKRYTTVEISFDLNEGEQFAIVDRMPRQQIKEFGLEPFLIVNSRNQKDEEDMQGDDANPFDKLNQRLAEERRRKADAERRRIEAARRAVEEAERAKQMAEARRQAEEQQRIEQQRMAQEQLVREQQMELRRRLEREGGHIGEVQVSLIWEDTNDLDLLVTTPRGNTIWFSNKVADGGTLDVDMNAAGGSDEPVENVVWNAGDAPRGSYTVDVRYYSRKSGPRGSSYKVLVKVGDHITEHSGRVYEGDRERVCIFEY